MKTWKLSLCAVLASLAAFGPSASAQEKKDEAPAKAPARGEGRRGDPQERLKQLAEELKLTDEQKEKLKPIFQEEMEKLKALREDTATPREAKFAKFREIQQANEAKIKPILTAEQVEKWEKLKGERKKRFEKK